MLFKFYLIVCLAILNAYAQDIDPTFCNFVPVTPSVDFPKQDDNIIYSVEIERNSANKKFTEEIREYYDGAHNIGISINTYTGQTVKTISDYDADELLIIKDYACIVSKLRENYQATPFFVTTDASGKEHITTGLSLLIKNQGANIAYLGEFVTRGIPVRRWGVCVYDKNSNSTLKIQLEYSNELKWTPANIQDGLKTVPVQMTIDSKNKYTGNTDSVVDFITRYRINILIDEEKYFADSGVYCPGKSSSKPFPKVPEAFSAWIQYSVPNNYSSYLEGSLRTYRIEHDFPKKLYRLDYYTSNDRFTEVHDYSTGLIYKMNRYLQTCEIKTIEDINSENEPQSSAILFETTQTPEYQYQGKRIVRGINTDVWIAPRKYMDSDSIWEWHFMTDEWVSQETNQVKKNEPVLLNIYFPINNQAKLRLQFHITQFDQSRIDLYDFDISTCSQEVANKHLTFSFTTENYEIFKANQEAFKDALMYAIQKYANIGLIRIGKLQTIYENNVIYAVMTLFDRPSKYGPVPAPQENNLNGAYETLKQTINAGNFKFIVDIVINIATTKQISVVADSDSLKDLQENNGRYYFVNVDTGETVGYTSGSVAGFAIGFILIGLLCGFVGGYFLIIKKSLPISIPGSFKPNLDSSA